jgi:hypothetical protein
MISIESHTYSFIIKIWLEEEPEERRAGQWRGHITHVESGERRYLRTLEDIPAYVASYLEAWGLQPHLLVPNQPPSSHSNEECG